MSMNNANKIIEPPSGIEEVLKRGMIIPLPTPDMVKWIAIDGIKAVIKKGDKSWKN